MSQPVVNPEALRQFFKENVAPRWGSRVDERMKALNEREVDVARRAGTTAQTLSKIRHGEIVPREYLRVAIAMALHTRVDELFPMPSQAELERVALAVA